MILYTDKGQTAHHMEATAMPSTQCGNQRPASALSGSTKAVLVDGDLTWQAAYGGLWANKIRIIQTAGDTGAGHENRPLGINADVGDEIVTVVFATDGAGASAPPTPAEIVAELAGEPGADLLVVAIDGGPTPATELNQMLAGGLDDGDWLRVNGLPTLACINTKV